MKRTVFLAAALFAFMATVVSAQDKPTIHDERFKPKSQPVQPQQAQTPVEDTGYYADPFSMRVFGVPRNKITASYTIYNASDWERALKDIKAGNDNTTYLLIIEEDVGIPGSTGFSFNPVVRVVTNQATGISWNEYHFKPVTIGITGKGKLYLTSDGFLLNINGQTVIIDGEVTLEGRKTNNLPLIFVNQEGLIAHTKLELRNGTLRGNGRGAVQIQGGEFTMRGGAITGNSSLNGGGVCIMGEPDGVFFTMSGGTISGNTAVYDKSAAGKGGYGSDNKTGSGGGIYLSGGRVSITGGTISGNKAVRGGAIFIYGVGGRINKSGGVIYGNDAKASERNTSSDGNTWGHAILYEEWSTFGFPSYFMGNYYRNTTLGEADTIILDFRSHSPDLLPTAVGKTKNGWTKQ